MVRPLVGGALALALALGGLVFATPAYANDPTTYSVPPNLTNLGSCAGQQQGNVINVGGWDRRSFYLADRSPAPLNGGKVVPVLAVLREVCIGSTGRLAFGFSESGNGPLTGDDRFGSGALTTTRLECLNASNSFVTYTAAPITSRLIGGGTAVTPTAFTELGNTPHTWVTNNCARLVAVQAEVRLDRAVGPPTYISVRWSAALWLGNAEYTNEPPVGAEEYCDQNPTGFLCDQWTDPSPVAWEDTCGDSANSAVYGVEYATFNPVDAATWGPATAWLGACLFVPLPEVGGFDRDGVVADAWEQSPNVEIGEQITNVSSAWAFAPGCGVLASTTSTGPLPGFTLNTCAWTWAEPVRAVLAIGVLVGGFWFFIAYTVRAVSGLVRKNVPSPVEVSE